MTPAELIARIGAAPITRELRRQSRERILACSHENYQPPPIYGMRPRRCPDCLSLMQRWEAEWVSSPEWHRRHAARCESRRGVVALKVHR